MFTSPGEICFSVFGVDVYYYGVVMAVAVLVGTFFSDFVRKKDYVDILESDFFNTVFVALIFGFLGARLYYCMVNFSYYSSHLTEILNFREGGISLHGGIIFALLFAGIFAYIKKLPVLKLCDLFAYGLILAQAIGRWGNFFNSEAFGKPTEIFCKLFIPVSHRPIQYINYEYFHPAFLYESILDVFIFLILFFVIRKYLKNYSGFVFVSYLFLYSCVRILVETVRIDSTVSVLNMPLPIFVSNLIICVSLVMFFILYRKYFKM